MSDVDRPRDRLVRWILFGAALLLLALVGLSGPNAASPDLAPHGWAPGALLPVRLSPAAVTAALWAAYGLGAVVVLLGLADRAARSTGWGIPLGLAALAAFTAPFGSGDHLNYAAYGRILLQGGNPWTASPIDWAGGHDPVTSRVEEPWTTEPSVYGPVATALHGLAAALGGDNLRQVVWVWQLVVIVSWLAVRWLLRQLLDDSAHARIDAVWTLNPLVLAMGLFGAHVDTVAAAFAVAALWAAHRAGKSGWVGSLGAGSLAALAGCTKFTYAVVLVAILALWWVPGRFRIAARSQARGERGRHSALLVGGFVVVAGLAHLWAGPHVYDQLSRARQSVSLATPWRLVLEALRGPLGEGGARTLITAGAAVLAVAFAAALLRLVTDVGRRSGDEPSDAQGADGEARGGPAMAVALGLFAILSAAYALAAPYSLPWYDAGVWAGLPAVAGALVDRALLTRLAIMSIAYVPGRVLGMSEGVRDVTMTVRRSVAPWVSLLVWLVILGAGLRAWLRSREPRAGAPR